MLLSVNVSIEQTKNIYIKENLPNVQHFFSKIIHQPSYQDVTTLMVHGVLSKTYSMVKYSYSNSLYL